MLYKHIIESHKRTTVLMSTESLQTTVGLVCPSPEETVSPLSTKATQTDGMESCVLSTLYRKIENGDVFFFLSCQQDRIDQGGNVESHDTINTYEHSCNVCAFDRKNSLFDAVVVDSLPHCLFTRRHHCLFRKQKQYTCWFLKEHFQNEIQFCGRVHCIVDNP